MAVSSKKKAKIRIGYGQSVPGGLRWHVCIRMINGFNSRCLHVITGKDYRATATSPVYDLVLAVRKRRMRYLGHVLRLPPDRIVRRSLIALVKGGTYYYYPEAAYSETVKLMVYTRAVDNALTLSTALVYTN